MSSRILSKLLLLAALLLPSGALAVGGQSHARSPLDPGVALLAQGKSDDAKGKGKAKGKAAEKAEKRAEKKAEKAEKKAEKAEKKAEKDAAKSEKKAEKDAAKSEKDADSPKASADARDARQRELEKHARRLAQIERIQAIGAKNDNEKLKEKAAKLRSLEDRRHTRALARLDKAPGQPGADEKPAGDSDEPSKKRKAPKKGDGK